MYIDVCSIENSSIYRYSRMSREYIPLSTDAFNEYLELCVYVCKFCKHFYENRMYIFILDVYVSTFLDVHFARDYGVSTDV